MDLEKDPDLHDILDVSGFMVSLKQALRVKVAGLGFLGVPCNSFNWMSSPQHRRTYWQPWGDTCYQWVEEGNIIASRAVLVIIALLSRSVYFMTENPDRGALFAFPPLVHLMSCSDILPLRVFWSGSEIFVHVHDRAVKFAIRSFPGTWDSMVDGRSSLNLAMEMRPCPSH